MMSDTKLKLRIFTIADFYEEEQWLRENHKNGWKLKKFVMPCFYSFEKCQPEDVIYRLDYKNNHENAEYLQLVKDYGWECLGQHLGWLYFRKPASETANENDGEIFSDNTSRETMIAHILKTRMLPIFILFLCCVLPNSLLVFDRKASSGFAVFWLIMLALYLFLLLYCGLKLQKLKKDLS